MGQTNHRIVDRVGNSYRLAAAEIVNVPRHTRYERELLSQATLAEAPMAARSLASITVTFGMVSIPVKLYSATQASAGISFNLLHGACGSRLKQQYLCAREGIVAGAMYCAASRSEPVSGLRHSIDAVSEFRAERCGLLTPVG